MSGTTRRFAALALLGAFLVLPSAARGSCENVIVAKSRELWFGYFDTYPSRASVDSTGEAEFHSKLIAMWDGMARGLVTAVQCERRLEGDRRLRLMLHRAPAAMLPPLSSRFDSDRLPAEPEPTRS